MQGPGPRPAARLLLDVESGTIAVSKATAPSSFKRVMIVSISRMHPIFGMHGWAIRAGVGRSGDHFKFARARKGFIPDADDPDHDDPDDDVDWPSGRKESHSRRPQKEIGLFQTGQRSSSNELFKSTRFFAYAY